MVRGRKYVTMGAYSLVVWIFAAGVLLKSRSGVSYGTTTGNATLLANLSLGFTGIDERMRHPFARVSICADALVMVPEDPAALPVTHNLEGKVGVTFEGPFVDFGHFRVPPGRYRELRIRVGGCGDASAVVENRQGRFSSRETFVLSWKQRIEIKSTHQRLWLPVDTVLRAAETLRSGREIAAELGYLTPEEGGRG